MVCLGASYSLKDPYVGAWTGVQASSLVNQIASKYFLSTVIETDDTVWPQLAAPVRLRLGASWPSWPSKTGYSLACNKTMVRFVSIDLAMARYWQTMPVFLSSKVASSYAQQGISQFQALTGEALGDCRVHTKRTCSISGIDLQTGQIFQRHQQRERSSSCRSGQNMV